MRLSNRVDTSKPRDWEITMKSFQQYRIDYLERGHICLWPEGSQEVKHLSWKQGWGKYKFSPVVLVFAVTIACRDISIIQWVWGMCFERAPVAQWSYEIEGKHCESKTLKVHNYLKRMLTAALALRYLFWISCCGRLPVLIRKHQLQLLEIQKSLLTIMLKVTESVRDLFWKRCCGKVTSPCIKSWPLAAPASKQQQQWKTESY